jgi:hypothetical protein
MHETKYSAPAANIGAEGFTKPACAATAGAKRPAILLSRLAIPEPVPRTGAGNTSGVYAYITPYMTFCGVRSSIYQYWTTLTENNDCTADANVCQVGLPEMVKRNKLTPVTAVDMAMVPLRPNWGMSTV